MPVGGTHPRRCFDNIGFLCMERKPLVQDLFQTEHAIWRVRIHFPAPGFWVMGIGVKRIEKFNNVEAASVHIEMDVTLLKIWRYGFPVVYFWMKRFHCIPSRVSDSLAVCIGGYEKEV